VTALAHDTLDAILAALLSPTCVVCGGVVDHPTLSPACNDCWRTIRFITPPFCEACGEPLLPDRVAFQRVYVTTSECCARCAAAPPIVDRARAIGPYEGTLRALVHALKYDGRRGLAGPLASLLRDRCGDVLDGAQAVVPVPLHRTREWSRGFNQADAIAKALGLPVWRVLTRARRTAPQTALAAGERRSNVAGAFAIRRGPFGRTARRMLRGSTAVLVDDVSTTGATLDECARVLKSAGVLEVRSLTVARAVLGHAVRA
jgi:ComF family protein